MPYLNEMSGERTKLVRVCCVDAVLKQSATSRMIVETSHAEDTSSSTSLAQ